MALKEGTKEESDGHYSVKCKKIHQFTETFTLEITTPNQKKNE